MRERLSECYLEMISVSLKFIMQKLLRFILDMNFMLSYNPYERLLMSKMLHYNKSEFRGKFTDSGRSILMNLEFMSSPLTVFLWILLSQRLPALAVEI